MDLQIKIQFYNNNYFVINYRLLMLRNSLSPLLKRLVYKSTKRGILENDLILGSFANQHLPTLNKDELSEYDELLQENDWDIFYWITGRKELPRKYKEGTLMNKLRMHIKAKEM